VARQKLETHLAALKRDGVSTWFDGDMNAGDALEPSIARELRRAHLFVALLSPEYLASHYCWKLEYQRAMNRRARGTIRVVAAVVRPCDWKSTRAAGFKLLPADGRPVTRWRSADEAFLNIAEGIRTLVTAIRKEIDQSPGKRARPSPPAKAARGAAKVKRVVRVKAKSAKQPAKPRPKKRGNAPRKT